jgi:hypothetical protein
MQVPEFVRSLYRYEPPSPEALIHKIKIENARIVWISETAGNLALALIIAFLISPAVEKEQIEVILARGTWIWLFVSALLYWYGYWIHSRMIKEVQ